jgi:hypothetical protein
MNQLLSEHRIRATCRELLSTRPKLSGRGLCVELKRRFGAVGNTQRVFAIWREELGAAAVPVEVSELKRKLAAAEAAAAENLARAQLAELQEESHLVKWATEIDRLRQENLALRSNAAEVRVLQERVLQLSRELMAVRAGR